LKARLCTPLLLNRLSGSVTMLPVGGREQGGGVWAKAQVDPTTVAPKTMMAARK
jgi:hypothetical protein